MYARRYVQERASEAIDASLAELDATLPRGLKGIRLQELSLGPNPPGVSFDKPSPTNYTAPATIINDTHLSCTPHG